MKKMIVVILFFILLFSGMAYAKGNKGKDNKPVWLDNPKAKYPEQMYLTAIGEGDTRQDAENMAAANLARVFETRIKADETVTQRYLELIKGNENSYEEMTDVAKSVNIQSEQTLMNIQFADSYTDNMGRVYALAYINRLKTGDIYAEKITKNADKINYFIEQNNKVDSSLYKYAFMSAASAISTANEILLEQLSIISPTEIDMLELNYNHNEIMQKTAELASGISFKIDIAGDREQKITVLVEELFNDLGFTLSDNEMLRAVGEITFEKIDLKRQEGYVFVRYDLKLKIQDGDGNTFVTLNEKGREGHTSYLEAQERCIRKLQKKIQNALKMKLIAYFDGMVTKKK